MAVAGCNEPGQGLWRSTGSYPLDIYPEMHYNQTYKSQEPPRLAPPPDSVPIAGKDLPLPALKTDAKPLQNPVLVNADALRQAGVLYHVNCAVCHGQASAGDGFVGLKFAEYGAPQPPSFASDRVRALSAGEAFWSITNGTGFMPPFGRLLKQQDRWLLVHLIGLSPAEREALLAGTKAPGYK
jgi:mono/diheme cytochrome c family protein